MAIATLSIDINARLANLERDLGKAAQIAEQNSKRMQEAFGRATSALAALGAAVSVGAFANMVKGVAEAGDQLSKLSTRTGIAVEELSKLQYAASLSDVSNEELGASLGRLNKILGEAADGSKEATAALARFGIAPGTMNVSEAFAQIADRVKNTSDQTKVASAMNDVFSKSWATLVPMLKGGSSGLKTAGDELERMGGVMSTELAEASERFNDNLTRLSTQLEALKIQTIGPLIPLFEEITKAMSDSSDKANSLAGAGNLLKTAFESVAVLGANVAYVFKQVGNEIGGIAAQAAMLLQGDFKGVSAIREMMIADGKKAREEIDALSERLLSTSAKVQQAVDKSGSTSKYAGISASPKKEKKSNYEDPLTKTADAYAKAIEAIDAAEAKAFKSTLNLNDAQTILFDLYNSPLWAEMPETWRAIVQQQADMASASIDAANAQKRLNDLLAETPTAQLEEARKDMELLTDALKNGQISEEQYLEAVNKRLSLGSEQIEEQTNLAKELGLTFSSAFEDAIVKGKGFSDVLKGIAEDIVRLLARKNITEPLAKSVGSFDWGSLLRGSSSTYSGGVSASYMDAMGWKDGGVFNSPSLSAYSGGVYNTPKFFKFASGAGVFGEAGPEAIMPLKRGKDGKLGVSTDGSGGSVTVNVINNASGTETTQRRRQGSNGENITDIIISAVKNDLIGDIGGGGEFSGALETQYALNRSAGAWR